MSVKVCPKDQEPVVFTFETPGAEWLCMVCGWTGDVFAARETEATAGIVARRDELLAEHERARGIEPPAQDQPRPSCTGCGAEAQGRLDHSGKPAHWFMRTIDGVTEYACSRGCISEGLVMPW